MQTETGFVFPDTGVVDDQGILDAVLGVGFNDIDLGSIEVIRTGSITDGFVYNVTGTNKNATYKNDTRAKIGPSLSKSIEDVLVRINN